MWSFVISNMYTQGYGSGQNNVIFQGKNLCSCAVQCCDEGHSDAQTAEVEYTADRDGSRKNHLHQTPRPPMTYGAPLLTVETWAQMLWTRDAVSTAQ